MRYIEEELLTLEEAEHIINTLLQLTVKQAVSWTYQSSIPILRYNHHDRNNDYFALVVSVKSEYRTSAIELELTDVFYLHTGRGDLRVDISVKADNGFTCSLILSEYLKRRQRLLFSETKRGWRKAPAVQLANVVLKQADAQLNGHTDILHEQSLSKYDNDYIAHHEIAAFMNKLVKDGRLFDFHRCSLDADYREKLIVLLAHNKKSAEM